MLVIDECVMYCLKLFPISKTIIGWRANERETGVFHGKFGSLLCLPRINGGSKLRVFFHPSVAQMEDACVLDVEFGGPLQITQRQLYTTSLLSPYRKTPWFIRKSRLNKYFLLFFPFFFKFSLVFFYFKFFLKVLIMPMSTIEKVKWG